MQTKSFHLSAQGASHIKKNKECQDASDSYYDENCAIAIVCDGHGGNDYVRSASGSAFACKAAKECLLLFIENVNKEEMSRHHNQLIHNLEASIISLWNEKVYDHYETHPFTEEEIALLSERAKRKYLDEKRIVSAYGTTLIAVVTTPDYWFGIHIGDGKCVAVNPEGKFLEPIPWDENCFLNATTSICDSDALNRFRYFYSEKLPVAVFVGSDGIDDCFCSEDQLHNLYKTVLYSFATTDFDEAISGLREYLPRLSAKGSGDDVSVAAVLDLDSIGEIEAVKSFDKEKEKARVEEKARIAAQKEEEERLRVEATHAEERNRQKSQLSAPKFCEKCGAKLHPGVNFCGHCGARILSSIADSSSSSTDELKIIKIIPFGSEGVKSVEDKTFAVDDSASSNIEVTATLTATEQNSATADSAQESSPIKEVSDLVIMDIIAEGKEIRDEEEKDIAAQSDDDSVIKDVSSEVDIEMETREKASSVDEENGLPETDQNTLHEC